MIITRPIPIATQVNAILRDRIREGKYPPGARLPSESELAKELDVSRATIRTVLTRLAAEGLILRKQGDGTYINERIRDVNTHLGGLWEFNRLIESSGYTPSIKTLSITERGATRREVSDLGIELGDDVVELRRLFFADSNPVILATNMVPVSLIDTSIGGLDGQLPISKFLQRYCHRKIAFVISDVGARLAGDGLADVLNLESGSPVL